MSEKIEFDDENGLAQYITEQIRMGNFDWEVEERFEVSKMYDDLYFQSAHDLDEFIEAEISSGEHDESVEKRAPHIKGLAEQLLPDDVHTERQNAHKSEHPDGVVHWSFCARCLERYK